MWSHGVIVLLLLAGNRHLSYAQEETSATLAITIENENGSVAQHAHIYFFSQNKKQFFGTDDASGISTFQLPAGDYRVYAAKTDQTNGIIDHYASSEAFVHLSADEPASVILSLRKADDRDLVYSNNVRMKLGLNADLSQNLN